MGAPRTFHLGVASVLALGLSVHAHAQDSCSEPGESCFSPELLVGSFPDARSPLLPKNARLFTIVRNDLDTDVFLDGRQLSSTRTPPAESAVHYFDTRTYAMPGLLEPGSHRMTVEVDDCAYETFAFEVDDSLAPPADESGASASITRVTRFSAANSRSFAALNAEKERFMADPTDCTPPVYLHYECDTGRGMSPGEYRVELEATGPVTGFFVNGWFLRSYCRSAFLWGLTTPLTVEAMTATGLTSPQEFVGEVESFVSADTSQRGPPPAAPKTHLISCGVTEPRPGGEFATACVLALALLRVAARRRPGVGVSRIA
jgi:hypothetical protein